MRAIGGRISDAESSELEFEEVPKYTFSVKVDNAFGLDSVYTCHIYELYSSR